MIKKMKCTKRVLWDNCVGDLVVAFRPGDVVDVEPCPNYADGQYGTATSPYYEDISDFVPLDHFVEMPHEDTGVRCRCCDQGKVKYFHCPACNDLSSPGFYISPSVDGY